MTNFCMNSVDDFSNVYVSSPADVSKSTRQRPNAPDDSAKLAQDCASISAASSNESGNSVGVADLYRKYKIYSKYHYG